MGITPTSICNSALAKIGAPTITSLEEQNKGARLCKRLYPTFRDDVLASYPWNFAITRVELAQLADVTPAFGYTYAYQLPSDCLRVLETETKDQEWKIEGRYLVTDEASIFIKYIRREENSSLFSIMFAEALAYRLAMELAYPITQNASLRDRFEKAYKEVLRDARTNDSQEGTPEDFFADDWLGSRI